MANRFILNETSYHGAGAIKEIASEVKARGFEKCFVCSDPDLIKFGLTKKVTDVLEGANTFYLQERKVFQGEKVKNTNSSAVVCSNYAGTDDFTNGDCNC